MSRSPVTGIEGSSSFESAGDLACGQSHGHFVEAFDAEVKINQSHAAEFDIDILKQNARFNQAQDRIIDRFARFKTHRRIGHFQAPENYNFT